MPCSSQELSRRAPRARQFYDTATRARPNGWKLPHKAPESRYSLRKGTRKNDSSHWIFATCLQPQTVSKLKLAIQIPLKCPHPNLLPPGEGTTSPLGEGWDEGFPPFATTLRRRAQKRRALSLTMTATPTPSPTTPSATDALVSWQGRLFEAKESGCEILD